MANSNTERIDVELTLEVQALGTIKACKPSWGVCEVTDEICHIQWRLSDLGRMELPHILLGVDMTLGSAKFVMSIVVLRGW